MTSNGKLIHLGDRLHKRVRFRADAQHHLNTLSPADQLCVWKKLRCVTRAGLDHLVQGMPLKLPFPTKQGLIIFGAMFIDEFILVIRVKNRKITVFYIAKTQEYLHMSATTGVVQILIDRQNHLTDDFSVIAVVTREGSIAFVWYGDLEAENRPPRGLEIPLAA